mmetsp:Transcript_19287/g.28727  ORF Transcript_19287/g.28727 Transcript_19287/m.28727 type:complete len:151 (-) Transcript_19287:710-1162(-)
MYAALLSYLESFSIYQDKYFIAINKPYGLVSQGHSGSEPFHSIKIDDRMIDVFSVQQLIELINKHAPNKQKLSLVHRLDKFTTGVCLIAKNQFAASKLSAMFRHRDVKKIYWALTQPVPPKHSRMGRIKSPLIVTTVDGNTKKQKNDDDS